VRDPTHQLSVHVLHVCRVLLLLITFPAMQLSTESHSCSIGWLFLSSRFLVWPVQRDWSQGPHIARFEYLWPDKPVKPDLGQGTMHGCAANMTPAITFQWMQPFNWSNDSQPLVSMQLHVYIYLTPRPPQPHSQARLHHSILSLSSYCGLRVLCQYNPWPIWTVTNDVSYLNSDQSPSDFQVLLSDSTISYKKL